jgi:hypothetical protein
MTQKMTRAQWLEGMKLAKTAVAECSKVIEQHRQSKAMLENQIYTTEQALAKAKERIVALVMSEPAEDDEDDLDKEPGPPADDSFGFR